MFAFVTLQKIFFEQQILCDKIKVTSATLYTSKILHRNIFHPIPLYKFSLSRSFSPFAPSVSLQQLFWPLRHSSLHPLNISIKYRTVKNRPSQSLINPVRYKMTFLWTIGRNQLLMEHWRLRMWRARYIMYCRSFVLYSEMC